MNVSGESALKTKATSWDTLLNALHDIHKLDIIYSLLTTKIKEIYESRSIEDPLSETDDKLAVHFS